MKSEGATQKTIATVKSVEDSCNIAIDILNDLLLFDNIDAGILRLNCFLMYAKPFLVETIEPFKLQVRWNSLGNILHYLFSVSYI